MNEKFDKYLFQLDISQQYKIGLRTKTNLQVVNYHNRYFNDEKQSSFRSNIPMKIDSIRYLDLLGHSAKSFIKTIKLISTSNNMDIL